MDWRTFLTVLLAGVTVAVAPVPDVQPALRLLLARSFSFSPSDLTDLEHGKVVAHGLSATAAGEVAAVRVKAARATFVDRYRDIAQFKRGADMVEIGRFSDPPVMDDLARLTL